MHATLRSAFTSLAPVGFGRHSACILLGWSANLDVMQQVSGTVDSATLASEGVQETGAGLDDLMAQLDALHSSR